MMLRWVLAAPPRTSTPDHPSLAAPADDVVRRYARVLEEDLVEVRVARHLPERTHIDARRVHLDQQVADPVVLRLLGLGPHEREHPFGLARVRGPDLLPVHHPVAVVQHGTRPK